MVVSFHLRYFHRGFEPHLQCAHVWHTQDTPSNDGQRLSLNSGFLPAVDELNVYKIKDSMRLKRAITHRSLNRRERLYLCVFIRSLVEVAKDHQHPMRKLARAQISMTMWRWTADGACLKTNAVRPDALKYDVRQLLCTNAARNVAQTTIKDLRHEHVVPRIMLAHRIIDEDMSLKVIYKFLSKFCKPVIVTKNEDASFSRSCMPAEWSWAEGCEYARYRDADLYMLIENFNANRVPESDWLPGPTPP